MSAVYELLTLLELGFFQRALLGGVGIGILAPLCGQYLVARRVSNFADGTAHIAILGIVFGLLLELSPFWFGLVVAVLGGILLEVLRERRLVQTDAAVTLLLVTSLALVSVLVGQLGTARSLESLLFGSILTITWSEVGFVWILVLLGVTLVHQHYRQLLTAVYQDDLARLVGVRGRVYNYALVIAAALVVGVAVDLIGGLLVSGLMIVPVLTAQLSGGGFGVTHQRAVGWGVGSVLGGLALAGLLNLPAGAAIALVAVVGFALQLGRALIDAD